MKAKNLVVKFETRTAGIHITFLPQYFRRSMFELLKIFRYVGSGYLYRYRTYCAYSKGGFLGFRVLLFMYAIQIQHCFIWRPSDSIVSEDVGIEPRTVASLALAVRRSNHSARSHSHSATGTVLALEKNV